MVQMDLLAILALTATVCVLQASAHEALTVRQSAVVLTDTCLTEEDISSRAIDEDITNTLSTIASELSGQRRSCLDQIYVMAFTSDMRYSDSPHPHNIEVEAVNQTRNIVLPDRPGDYDQHKGDLWKLNIFNDLGFEAGSCVRVCNIRNITLVEGGNNGWNIDSVVTFGCVDDVGCTPMTQDIDVFRWVDGDSHDYRRRFTLTKLSNAPCIF